MSIKKIETMHVGGYLLIETVMYIGLFSTLIVTLLASIVYFSDSARARAGEARLDNERMFVLRKIEWVLSSVETINAPPEASEGGALTLHQYESDSGITLYAEENVLYLKEDGAPPEPLSVLLRVDSFTVSRAQVGLHERLAVGISLDGILFNLETYHALRH